MKPTDSQYETLREQLDEVGNIKEIVIQSMGGQIEIRGDVVYYNGNPINNAITDRIIRGAKDGFDMTAYINFLENIMLNPSFQTIKETYLFMEANSMGITDDGHILAYKRVRENFRDIYSDTMDNSPNTVVSMPRNLVNDNRDETCSDGLHACYMAYLPHYGKSEHNTIVIVKIHPKDVVSVPSDYKNAKMRCCEYLVLDEYDEDDKLDILSTQHVFSTSQFNYDDGEFDENEHDSDFYEDEHDVNNEAEDYDYSDLMSDAVDIAAIDNGGFPPVFAKADDQIEGETKYPTTTTELEARYPGWNGGETATATGPVEVDIIGGGEETLLSDVPEPNKYQTGDDDDFFKPEDTPDEMY